MTNACPLIGAGIGLRGVSACDKTWNKRVALARNTRIFADAKHAYGRGKSRVR